MRWLWSYKAFLQREIWVRRSKDGASKDDDFLTTSGLNETTEYCVVDLNVCRLDLVVFMNSGIGRYTSFQNLPTALEAGAMGTALLENTLEKEDPPQHAASGGLRMRSDGIGVKWQASGSRSGT